MSARQLTGIIGATMLAVALGTGAYASTVTQNTTWLIDRSGTSTTYRVVGYGDSIYAGYYGSVSSVAKRAAPWVEGEYLSAHWNADIEVIRRAKSGAVASDIYQNKIVAENSYMKTANTRIVTYEMCGNDGLQARSNLSGQSGTCNYGVLENALANCTTYQELSMQYINANAHPNTELKIVATIYYPGYDADNALANCTDPTTGVRPNKQDIMMPYLVKMNWRTCNFANTYGFECADSFAEYMGADYDSNGDGLIDSEALRYVQGESEEDYVTRLSQTLRSTVRDANYHFVDSSTSYDYIQSDDVHPTYTGSTIYVGFFGGTGSGSGAPDYPTITNGKNPIWNQYGHERMGWSLWAFNDAPAVTPTPTPVPPTNTPANTPTNTPVPTDTAPPANTATATNTAPPANTATATNTAPPTNTPTNTIAPTSTPTAGSCVASGEGAPCTSSTNCCSGVGNCTNGRPANRVCAN